MQSLGAMPQIFESVPAVTGVGVIEVETPEALELAIGPKTAMIYIFAGPPNDSGPMSTEAICRIAVSLTKIWPSAPTIPGSRASRWR